MAAKNVIIALLALCSFAYGQTRALIVTTNGRINWDNAIIFGGPLEFVTNNASAATTRSNLSLGLPALTNSSNAGLLSALGGMTTNGDAAGLTNFPTLLLRTNGNAAALTNFPASLLRTNGDGSGLTNLPNADLGSATGILPLANGGTGATNASGARTALELGTAATNDATAFQPANTNLTALAGGDGSSLTNVTITDASTLTNFPAELLRTNGDASGLTNFPPAVLLTNGNAGGLTNFPAELLRTNGDASGLTGVATYPAFSNNAGKVLAVATNEAGVEWLPVSNTVTDASLLTNFPASLLTTNGNAAGLTNFPAELLRTNGSAAGLTGFPASLLTTNGDASGLSNFPTFNQNTTGTASNVTGVVAIANGGTGASNATNARVNLLPSYTGNSNRVLALNSNATDVVWAVDGGGTADLANVTGVLAVANGGTGNTNAAGTNTTIVNANGGVRLGLNVTNTTAGAAIGSGASVSGSGIAGGVAIGKNAQTTDTGSALGDSATAGSGGAVGRASSSSSGGAVGFTAVTGQGGAVGANSTSTNGFAGGNFARALASTNVQLGIGTNSSNETIQFLSAGTVDKNEWSALANSTTFGHYLMAAPTNGTNGQILALNSNATAVIWTNNAAGGGSGTVTSVSMTVPDFLSVSGVPITTNGTIAVTLNNNALPVSSGGTGGTNSFMAFSNLSVYVGSNYGTNTRSVVQLGPNAAIDTSLIKGGVVIGAGAFLGRDDSIAIGSGSIIRDGLLSDGIGSIAIGYEAEIGDGASQSAAIGYKASVAGYSTNSVQLGIGTNLTARTIQFLSAGSVSTNQWGYLANASTKGGSRMTNTNGVTVTNTIIGYNGTNYTTNTITVIDGIITSWTQ